MKFKTQTQALNILGLIIICACGIAFFEGFRDHVDLVMADDSGYLAYSKTFPSKLRQGYGPGYVLLFKIFGFFFDDSIDVHYIVIAFCSVITGIGLFIMLRSLKLAAVTSLIISIFFLFSNLNMSFDWWSRISHYSVFFLFLFVALTTRLKKTGSIWALGTLVAFGLSYVRPETFLTFLILAFITVLYIAVSGRKEMSRSGVLTYILGGLFMFLVLFKIGSPMEGGSRLMLAFAQHYTLNLTQWNNLPLTECLYWQEVFVQNFGQINSLSDLWTNGKTEIIRHLNSNFRNYFQQTFEHLGYMLIPQKIFGINHPFTLLILVAFYFAYIAWVGLQDYLQQLLEGFKKHGAVLMILLLFFAPTWASSIVIYPREHYLVLQLAFIYLLIYLLISPTKPGNTVVGRMNFIPWLIIVGVILFFLTPDITKYPTKRAWGPYNGIKIVHGIHAVRDLDIKEKPVHLLTSTGPMSTYLSDNYDWIVPFNKTSGFNRLMDSLDVNMIYVDDILLVDRRYSNDPEFNDFLSSYETKGWVRRDIKAIPNNEHYILIKEDLL